MSRVDEKLKFLFRTNLSPDGDEYTYEEVSEGTGDVISPSYVWNLKNGKKLNPSRAKMEALAKFFDVSPSYFFDEEEAFKKSLNIDERIMRAIEDPVVRDIALRALDLSDNNKEFILVMVEKAKELVEGK
ncbi:MAG: helix-turn-helix transcriptional regulator [Candidatus Subteraquimicrobiales bacterium]|nr:helix-turn-helix transcriptional regulator [Candidatus Subteraquimicrobiales bacterium]